MSRFRFPFPFGSVPAPETAPAPAPSFWNKVSPSAQAWNSAAPGLHRFEHVRWGLGRKEWNGGVLLGQLTYVVDVESGFLVASEGNAVIASNTTVNR